MSAPNLGVNVHNSMDCTQCMPRSSSCRSACCMTIHEDCDSSDDVKIYPKEEYPNEADAAIVQVTMPSLKAIPTPHAEKSSESDSPLRPRCVIL